MPGAVYKDSKLGMLEAGSKAQIVLGAACSDAKAVRTAATMDAKNSGDGVSVNRVGEEAESTVVHLMRHGNIEDQKTMAKDCNTMT